MRLLTILISLLAVVSTAVEIDNEINSVAPDMVFDYDTNYAGFWNNVDESRALIRFDVDPVNNPATLILYTYRGEPGRTFSVYEIAEDWDGYVTWNAQPDLGDRVAKFRTVGHETTYYIEVPRVPDFGWEVKNDLGEMIPVEVWSFESYWPPVLETEERTNVKPESYGYIKVVFNGR